MKFKIESKFVNDYLYSQSQKKKEIQNRKRKMRIETEIENGFSKMFSDKIKEFDNQKGENMIEDEVTLIQKDNEILTSSLDVADKFGKSHAKVLRKIEDIGKDDSSQFWFQCFFLSSYTDASGKENKMYMMNKDGFAFLVMGFTGTKANEWKWRYIQAFNKMEQAIRNGIIEIGYEQRMKANLFDNIEGQKLKWLTNKEIVEKNYKRRGAYAIEDVTLFFNLRKGQFTRYMKEHNFNERTFPNCFTSYWSETTTSKPLLGVTKEGMNYISQHLDEVQGQLLLHSK